MEADIIGDDVVFRATVDGTDGDDRRVERVDLAADDCLEREHDLRRENHGVFRLVRHRTMPAEPAHDDVDAV